MVEIKKFFSYLLGAIFYGQGSFNKDYFYFLFNKKTVFNQIKMNIDTKCLVLSQYPGAETRGLGGLIAQYPKNFEVLSLTKGLSDSKNSINFKYSFYEVMKMTRVKGCKVFDIEDGTLKDNFQTFKKIDISEADYIFIPNLYDTNEDTIALLAYFKKILKEKEHKKTLKIFMYESDFNLCLPNYYVDISSIIETKKRMLQYYYPENKFPNFILRLTGLNMYRSVDFDCNYIEAFMGFSVNEFLNIPISLI